MNVCGVQQLRLISGALLWLNVSLLTACAPGLGAKFSLEPLPSNLEEGSSSASATNSSSSGPPHSAFSLAPVSDARPATWIVEISGRVVPPRDDVAVAAEKFIRKKLLRDKILLRTGVFPLVEVSVLTWNATVVTGLPTTTLEARAAIEATVRGFGNKPLYRVQYRGDVSRQAPWIGEQGIREDLFAALDQSLDAWLKDEAFQRALRQGAE